LNYSQKLLTNYEVKRSILILTVLGLVLGIVSCNKITYDGTNPQQVTQGVSFSIAPGTTPGGLKSDCFSQTISYANVWLDGGLTPIKVGVFYIAGQPYTNSIQLTPGQHFLNDFVLMNDNNTPTNIADDIILAAAPHSGSVYAPYVTNPLTITFTVAKFGKLMQPVECVCYQQSNYTDFGFLFFQIQEVTVRQQAFFGDLCIKNISDYIGSLYAQQTAGLQPDVPAIFKIEVWRNGTLMSTFDNSAWLGVGQPLLVSYADRQGIVDNFEFKLYVLVRQGAGFNYVYFTSWFATDGGTVQYKDNLGNYTVADKDSNGVIDFSLGYCSPDADLVLPPYINLPTTCTYKVTHYAPGYTGGYSDAALSNVPANYEFGNGTVKSWCDDFAFTITVNTAYNMVVYSSLYPNLLPAFAQAKPWDKIDWLLNHLSWYSGYHWYDLQGAMWVLCGWTGPTKTNVTYPLGVTGSQMVSDANTYGAGYKVPDGGFACTIFIASGTPGNATVANIQTMVIQLDP
jgi:hypothetical protein